MHAGGQGGREVAIKGFMGLGSSLAPPGQIDPKTGKPHTVEQAPVWAQSRTFV